MSFARSDLGLIGERLRRILNLAGADPVDYEPKLTPVVVVGDACGVGYSATKGRRWVWSIETGAAALGTFGWAVAARVPVVIDQIFLQCYTTGTTTNDPTRYSLNYTGWADAVPLAVSSSAGSHYAEGVSLAAEVGPMIYGAGTFVGGSEFARGMTTAGYQDQRGIVALETRVQTSQYACFGGQFFTINAVGIYIALGGRLL